MIAAPRSGRLEDWLEWQQRAHPTAIDLGLDRVRRVLERTGWRRPHAPVITVGGTNGKGSTVALLEAVLGAAGLRVGSFTSPHLVDYRERVRVDGAMATEPAIVAAFERIASALGPDSLTYFEHNAIAALLVFEQAAPDALLLEVGLGGRLDAVNVVDADVAVVVSVGLDHVEYLGDDVEAIGREKAGIFRTGRPAVFGAPSPPRSVRDAAAAIGTPLLVRGEDFDARVHEDGRWDFVRDGRVVHAALSPPALAGDVQYGNAATALAALGALAPRLDVARPAIEQGLREVRLPGRFQRVADAGRGIEWILDVAHNPAAAAKLARQLAGTAVRGRTIAVCGMLGDKDVPGVVAALRETFDHWYAATPEGARALDASELARRAAAAGVEMQPAGRVPEAISTARAASSPGDRIVVFGSFLTVGPALASLGVPL